MDLRLGNCMDVMAALPDASIDLIFTDPPYGHNNNDGDLISQVDAVFRGAERVPVEKYRPIANDGPEADLLFKDLCKHAARLLKPGACLCSCCGGGGPDPMFARWSLWMAEVLDFKMMVVWDKGPMGLGHHYRRSYEVVLVAQKPGAACKWYAAEKNVENIIRPGAYGISKIIPSAEQHPTEKPAELSRLFIELHSQPGETVLDPFMGSGSTGESALALGREFIGVEIDPQFYAMASKRLENVGREMFV